MIGDADPDTRHSIAYISGTPVLILAMSRDKKWRVVARMSSFVIFCRYRHPTCRYGDHWYGEYWYRVRRIARMKPYRGTASVAKLQDFTFEEHQAVIHAMHSAMRRVGK